MTIATEYPVYEPGQTLTAHELNTTTAFLMARDQLLGRLIGFGINAGLGGSVTGLTLTISPGLAIDQLGRPVLLPTAQDINLPPTSVTPSYDFINSAVDGFSVVIETDEDVAAPLPCGEAGCGGHPEVHTPVVHLRVVKGRITGTWMDFDTDDLLKVKPILVDASANPVGWTYEKLRDAIATRLTNGTDPLVATTLIDKLKATTLASGDLPGVKAYKCGWLNMVLFATLDLLRCEALCELLADKTTNRPGVVLGWVHQDGSGWVFDCSYRHSWEPPRGFTEAFLGGTCTDPCAIYRDEVEGLLGSFGPPDPPPAGGGGTPPKPHHCTSWELATHQCFVIEVPPKELNPKWYEHWKLPPVKYVDPLGPVWQPPIKYTPHEIYEKDGLDYLHDGVLRGTDLLGYPAAAATDVLGDTVAGLGGKATILTARANELEGISGYEPSVSFSPSDTMVLTVNNQGTVIGTGRVSVQHTTREMGAALPQAIAAADTATKAAAGIEQTVQGFENRVGAFDEHVKGLDTSFKTLEGQVGKLTTLNDRVVKMEGSVQVLSGGKARADVQGFDVEFARGISEFAQTTVQAMRSLGQVGNRNFERYTAAAERAQAELDLSVATGDPAALTVATLGVLDSMRTMVKASGVDAAAGRALDTQLRGLQGMVR